MKPASEKRMRQKLVAKIRALLAKTPDRGATVPEARSAWEKAEELMQRYGITASEVGFERMPDWYVEASDLGSTDTRVPADSPDEAKAEPFDYDALPPEVAAKMKQAASRIRESARSSVVAIGEQLLIVKDLLKHGEFLKHFRAYVATACHMSIRSAENAMAAALLLRDPKNAKFANLPVAGIYILARRSTPERARDAIRQLLSEGHSPHLKYIQKIVDELSHRSPRPRKAPVEAHANDQAFNCALNGFAELVMAHVPREKWCLVPSFLVTLKNEKVKVLLDRFEQSIDRANRAKAA
jgi:hypothetical protein